MRKRLAGRAAVIAGVGPGMGSAIAVRLADEGAAVFLAARTEDRLTTLTKTIEDRGGKAHAAACDLADHADVLRLLASATRAFGGEPDVLVNAAGGWKQGAADTFDADVLRSMLRINLETVMTTTPVFAKAMKAGGSIINIGATYGANFPTRGQAVYNAAKAGVRGYTESAAADLLAKGVRVNCVLPGGTSHEYTPDRELGRLRRLGRDTTGVPEDIAAAVAFLASDDAAWITGASLTVDGGAMVRR